MPKIAAAVKTNREAWLTAALPLLQKLVFAPKGLTIPADVRVACSWPGGGSARKRIGECWARRMSAAGINEIFISPVIESSILSLDILCHELCHAIDDCKSGHGAAFGALARSIGLEGKLTATHAGDELKAKLGQVAAKIGPYPHRALNLSGRKKQTTRLIKCECISTAECGAVWRMTAQWIERAAELTCPICQGEAKAHIE